MLIKNKLALSIFGLLIICSSLPAISQNMDLWGGGTFRTDTLFPQIEVAPDSFYFVIKPDSILLKQITLSNVGEDTLFYQLDANSQQWLVEPNVSRSIEGSQLTSSLSGYKPGQSIDFTFDLYNGSTDNEWLDSLSVIFPAGVTVNFATNFTGGSLGPLVYDGSPGNGSLVRWNDEDAANGGNILPGETATSIANLSFDENLNDTLKIIYRISGDVNGNEPHSVVDTLIWIPQEVWLIADPDSGMVLPGAEEIIDLYFNSAGIPIGSYQRYFTIFSNDTTYPELDIPVNMIVFPSSLTHTIDIPEGWSGISTYVLPLNSEFETIFDTVNDKIEAIHNIHSQLYWPDENINTIGDWNTFDGYIVNAKEPLQIKVYGIFEISQTVLLYEGWNVIPVLNSVASSSFVVFRDIDEKIDVVREIGGDKVYWPEQSIYTLTHLMPGQAYYIRVKEDCFIVFPPPVK